MTNKYKQIQLTNTNIGAVAIDGFLPLGLVTRRINAPSYCCNTFVVGSSTADTLTVTEPGFYKVTYLITPEAAAEGPITITLLGNGTAIHSISDTFTAADAPINMTLIYTTRVCPNCASTPTNCPVNLQLQLSGTALTSATANLIVEKI
jgi:hypothetical protein